MLLFGVLLVAALGTPFLPEKLKSYVFCNVFETRHWATVEPLVEGQQKATWLMSAPKGCLGKRPNSLF